MQRLLALLTAAAFLAAQPVYACAFGCLVGAHVSYHAERGASHGHRGDETDGPHAPHEGGRRDSAPPAPCSGGAVTDGAGACQPPLTHSTPRIEPVAPVFFTALTAAPATPAVLVPHSAPSVPDTPPPRA